MEAGLKEAVVHAGGARYVGKVLPSTKPGQVTTVHEAYELLSGIITMGQPQPNGTVAQGIAPMTVPVLIDGCDRFIDVEVFVTAIRFCDSMGKDEVDFLAKAREQKKMESQQRRAAAAGIQTATALPGGMKFPGQP